MVMDEPTMPPGSLYPAVKEDDYEGLGVCLGQAAYVLKSESSKQEDPHYKSALAKSSDNVKFAAIVITRQRDEIEQLRHKMRMIVSHASGGGLQDIDLPTNHIAVEITRHVNRVWEEALSKGTKDTFEECAKYHDRHARRHGEQVRIMAPYPSAVKTSKHAIVDHHIHALTFRTLAGTKKEKSPIDE